MDCESKDERNHCPIDCRIDTQMFCVDFARLRFWTTGSMDCVSFGRTLNRFKRVYGGGGRGENSVSNLGSKFAQQIDRTRERLRTGPRTKSGGAGPHNQMKCNQVNGARPEVPDCSSLVPLNFELRWSSSSSVRLTRKKFPFGPPAEIYNFLSPQKNMTKNFLPPFLCV